MRGMSARESNILFASITFTKPTGTPITRAGFASPSRINSQRRINAVGAFPIAYIAEGYSLTERSMLTIARVMFREWASAIVSGSETWHTIFTP